jgi:hypothetical protein
VVPDHERLVEVRSKSQYDRIHAGWRACVVPAIRNLSSTANHVEEREAADVSKAPNGSGVPKLLAAPTALANADAASAAVEHPAASDVFQGSAASISRCCGFARRWQALWLGWRIVDDYLARRKTASIVVPVLCPIASSMSSNGHWFGTTPGASREIGSPLGRASEAIRHSSRAGRGKALIRTCRTTRRTSNTTSPGDARARR